VVIVPGTGVLEANLGQRAWQMPFWLFLLCLAGRVTGTPVALVNVGADPASAPLVRWLYRHTVRLARFRSYRDAWSRDAVVAMGVRGDPGPVSRDLVFAESVAVPDVTGSRLIGVGVMDYHGPGNDPIAGRRHHESYLDKIGAFVTWLTDEGFSVRLVVGDAVDVPVAREVEARVRRRRPELSAAAVQADAAASYAELLDQLAGARAVLVSRFHNLIAALELGKPAMTLQYGPKNRALLAEVGLADFSQDLASWDVEVAKAQFRELLADEDLVRPTIAATTARFRKDVGRQLARLSSQLLPGADPEHLQSAAPVVVRPRSPEQDEQPRSPLPAERLPPALAPAASPAEVPTTGPG
jgi:polysaccharide pyruvyl transferase WcaK-like protein